jgi:hypothetical protein
MPPIRVEMDEAVRCHDVVGPVLVQNSAIDGPLEGRR